MDPAPNRLSNAVFLSRVGFALGPAAVACVTAACDALGWWKAAWLACFWAAPIGWATGLLLGMATDRISKGR
jgi:hypothetical protein